MELIDFAPPSIHLSNIKKVSEIVLGNAENRTQDYFPLFNVAHPDLFILSTPSKSFNEIILGPEEKNGFEETGGLDKKV